jgi:hypothetical protein
MVWEEVIINNGINNGINNSININIYISTMPGDSNFVLVSKDGNKTTALSLETIVKWLLSLDFEHM